LSIKSESFVISKHEKHWWTSRQKIFLKNYSTNFDWLLSVSNEDILGIFKCIFFFHRMENIWWVNTIIRTDYLGILPALSGKKTRNLKSTKNCKLVLFLAKNLTHGSVFFQIWWTKKNYVSVFKNFKNVVLHSICCQMAYF
jgi:hypothetical protein